MTNYYYWMHQTEIYTTRWETIKFGANSMGYDGLDMCWTGN